jgi:hypothetical protein
VIDSEARLVRTNGTGLSIEYRADPSLDSLCTYYLYVHYIRTTSTLYIHVALVSFRQDWTAGSAYVNFNMYTHNI